MLTSTALTFVFGLALSLIVVNSEQLFTCDFETDTCGFTNDEETTATWVRKEVELGGRKGYVMTIEPNDATIQRAKMGKSYSEIHNRTPGCFSFDYYTFGNGTQYVCAMQKRNVVELTYGALMILILSLVGKKQDSASPLTSPQDFSSMQ
ncbi:hypothetical protein X975_13547, partial [Stegodyphus mimosarum]